MENGESLKKIQNIDCLIDNAMDKKRKLMNQEDQAINFFSESSMMSVCSTKGINLINNFQNKPNIMLENEIETKKSDELFEDFPIITDMSNEIDDTEEFRKNIFLLCSASGFYGKAGGTNLIYNTTSVKMSIPLEKNTNAINLDFNPFWDSSWFTKIIPNNKDLKTQSLKVKIDYKEELKILEDLIMNKNFPLSEKFKCLNVVNLIYCKLINRYNSFKSISLPLNIYILNAFVTESNFSKQNQEFVPFFVESLITRMNLDENYGNIFVVFEILSIITNFKYEHIELLVEKLKEKFAFYSKIIQYEIIYTLKLFYNHKKMINKLKNDNIMHTHSDTGKKSFSFFSNNKTASASKRLPSHKPNNSFSIPMNNHNEEKFEESPINKPRHDILNIKSKKRNSITQKN